MLEYLNDNPAASPSVEVPFGPLAEVIGDDAIRATVPPLIDRGYINSWASLAGYSGGFLQPAGAEVVEDVRSHRESMTERNMAVRDRILYWLHEQGPGAQPVLSRFLESKYALFYGKPFAEKEVNNGSRWLKELGYISGGGSLQGGIVRPKITAKGTRVVEGSRSVNDSPDANPSHTFQTTFNGPTSNVAMGSNDFTQNSTTVVEAADGLATVVAAVQEAFELLAAGGADRNSLKAAIAEAEAVAESPNEAGMIRSALTKMQTVVAAGTGSAVGAILLDRIAGLLELLPG